MSNAVTFLQMRNRKIRTSNIILFLLGIALLAYGIIQSSERIAITLVGSSASNYQDVVKGALLFRVGYRGSLFTNAGQYIIFIERKQRVKGKAGIPQLDAIGDDTGACCRIEGIWVEFMPLV